MVYNIETKKEKVDWECIQSIEITHYPWGKKYMPKTYAWLYHVEGEGFYLKMRCEEQEPRAIYTEDNKPVYRDSCMEFFANYYPEEEGTGYINFEMNSNGAVLCQYGTAEERYFLSDKGLVVPKPVVTKGEDYWEIQLMIPESFIKEVYQKEEINSYIIGNFYKCGDDTHTPHYGSWSAIDHPTPAFHKPEFFGKMTVSK